MKIYADKLPQTLKQGLAPLYLLSGDEILLVQEAQDLICKQAKANGFDEKNTHDAGSNFSWDNFQASLCNRSLFASKTLHILRMPEMKLTQEGKNCLANYAKNPSKNNLLLIITGKIDKATQNTKWFKAIEQGAVFIQVWPITLKDLPNFIAKRLQAFNLQAEPYALRFLAENTDGNLLATAQEIEKLALIYQNKTLTLEEILNACADSSRYDLFALTDSALKGDKQHTVKILENLKNADGQPVLILWALSREIRTLLSIKHKTAHGESLQQTFKTHAIWPQRQPLFQSALKRHPETTLQKLLKRASDIDLMIKGLKKDNVWDKLMQLSLRLASRS